MESDKPIRVLLVDDSEADQGIIRRFMAESVTCRFELSCASTCAGALNSMRTHEPDICLIDYRLGPQSGLELLSEILQEGDALPVILLTGMGSVDLALEALRRGAVDYLDKDALSPALLERSIRYAIENFRIRKELKCANESLEAKVRERTAELERSNQELEHFAQVISHELQAPLRTVTGYIERLREEHKNGAPAEEHDLSAYFLDRAFDSAYRMNAMISSVLDYSRVGNMPRQPQWVAAGEIVAEVLADLDLLLKERAAVVHVDWLPELMGHRNLLREVFENLIKNALKHGGQQQPVINVWCERGDDHWVFCVHDNGCGVPPEESERVFRIFYRVSDANPAGGDGIGLALCKRIVEYHGGAIWLDTTIREGALFRFALPVGETASPQARGHATGHEGKIGAGNMRGDSDGEREIGNENPAG